LVATGYLLFACSVSWLRDRPGDRRNCDSGSPHHRFNYCGITLVPKNSRSAYGCNSDSYSYDLPYRTTNRRAD